MTTNGMQLAQRAADLRRAGLRRVTVSLDSLDRARLEHLTRRDAPRQRAARNRRSDLRL